MKASGKKALLFLSGCLPLLGLTAHPPDVMPLIYTVFAGSVLFRPQLERLAAWMLPGRPLLAILISFEASGALIETLAWASNYLKAAKEPALFHPRLGADLVIGLGFYGGWAAAWAITLRRYRFQLWQVFVITGLQGIFYEQLGAVFASIVRMLPSQPLMSLLFALYVFTVHGSAAGLALAPALYRLESPAQSTSPWRFVLVVVLMVSLAFLGCWLIQLAAVPFGGLPVKRSITEHPFW